MRRCEADTWAKHLGHAAVPVLLPEGTDLVIHNVIR